MLRGVTPMISAACNQLIAPLIACRKISCTFMARSQASRVKSMPTSVRACTSQPEFPQSGHFTCSRERTDHELPTFVALSRLRGLRGVLYSPRVMVDQVDTWKFTPPFRPQRSLARL